MIALVLGAGGLTGQAFHLGALTALAEVGLDGRAADVLVGTSAGSLVAAGLAAGLSVADQTALLLGEAVSRQGNAVRTAGRLRAVPQPVLEPRRGPLAATAVLAGALRPWSARPAAVLSGLLPAGRQSTTGIVRGVNALHSVAWPDRDLRVCAVRARDARRTVFGTPGAPPVDVGTAVAASCAIPGWFAPVHVAGQAYVDGGVHSASNADVVLPDPPDVVVVLSPMSITRAAPRADLAVRLAVRAYLAAEVLRLRRRGSQVLVLQPGAADLAVMGANPMRGARAREVVTTVAASVRDRLQQQPHLVELLRG